MALIVGMAFMFSTGRIVTKGQNDREIARGDKAEADRDKLREQMASFVRDYDRLATEAVAAEREATLQQQGIAVALNSLTDEVRRK